MSHESDVVKAFNAFFAGAGIDGIAFRLKQSRFITQIIDVLVDGACGYLAVECKSISVEKGEDRLGFSEHFSVDKKGKHQIARISEFIKKSRRHGYLFVELRRGGGRPKKTHVLPWSVVEKRYHGDGLRGFRVSEIEQKPTMERFMGLLAKPRDNPRKAQVQGHGGAVARGTDGSEGADARLSDF